MLATGTENTGIQATHRNSGHSASMKATAAGEHPTVRLCQNLRWPHLSSKPFYFHWFPNNLFCFNFKVIHHWGFDGPNLSEKVSYVNSPCHRHQLQLCYCTQCLAMLESTRSWCCWPAAMQPYASSENGWTRFFWEINCQDSIITGLVFISLTMLVYNLNNTI